jgi:type I restriction enzyme S subunit
MSEQTKLNDIANQETGVNFRSPSVLTRAEQLPSGWDVADANSITKIKTGHTPSTDTDEYWNGNIPWIAIHDLSGLDTVEIDETEDNITEEGLANSGAKLIPEGALALCRTGSIGESAILNREMATDQSTVTFECYPDLSNPYFLMHIFQWCQPKLERLGIGSTHPSIQLDFFPDLQFLTPPLSEQRKIATVLHTVDQAIQKTGEAIECIKRLEQGLMQDLFRRGVEQSETKELRRIGEVPQHWEVVNLGDVCTEITDGTHKSPPTIDDGYPYVTSQNVRDWGFDLIDLKYISKEDHERITSRCNPEANDVLYVKDGANTGNVNVNTLDFEFSLLSSVALIKPDRHELKPWFLKYLLSWSKFRQLVLSQMSGTGISRLTISKLEKTDILLPPIEEQERIVEVLDTYYEHHKNQREYRDQLKYLKRGLMQDLLSGEVRTTDVDIDIPEEVVQYG